MNTVLDLFILNYRLIRCILMDTKHDNGKNAQNVRQKHRCYTAKPYIKIQNLQIVRSWRSRELVRTASGPSLPLWYLTRRGVVRFPR